MPIDLVAASISIDEGSVYYSGNFTLANYLEGPLFNINTPFVFDMYGEEYHFIVDSKEFRKPEFSDGTGPDLQVVLSCLSPAVQLAAPRATNITKTWTTTTARAIAEEVLAGFPMDWQILDWPISNNLYSVTDKSPIDIVKELVAAVGGLVESLPDGSLVVRYKFPVSVPLFGAGTTTHILQESEEMVEGTDGYVNFKILDKYRIMDSASALGADRLEFEDLGSGIGVVRTYPSPWRTNFILRSTLSTVTIGPQEYEEREEEEVVEVINGKASVRYPVLSLVSATFLDENLVGVQVTTGSTEISTTSTVSFYSLLRIVYKVRSLRYNVLGPLGSQAQFLMEE